MHVDFRVDDTFGLACGLMGCIAAEEALEEETGCNRVFRVVGGWKTEVTITWYLNGKPPEPPLFPAIYRSISRKGGGAGGAYGLRLSHHLLHPALSTQNE